MKLRDIHIRDPFVLPVAEDGVYYLYGSIGATAWSGKPEGFNVYRSRDLEEWDGPLPAFRPAPDFWSSMDYWAPEVHRYNGRYYMLASFKAPKAFRGTQILVSDSPVGPFVPLTDRPVTPRNWECLDGTLFVDDVGEPWIVFCHEWVQVRDGAICAMKLSRDLTHAVARPVYLFNASHAPWAKVVDDGGGKLLPAYVTDGPFLHHLPNGDLAMIWSSFSENGYAVGMARSANGKIDGDWIQSPAAIFDANGGHGMLFRTFGGKLLLSLHQPNDRPHERPVFLPVSESNDALEVLPASS